MDPDRTHLFSSASIATLNAALGVRLKQAVLTPQILALGWLGCGVLGLERLTWGQWMLRGVWEWL